MLALPLTHACDGGDDGTSPLEAPYLTGTYVGDYTASLEPGTVYRARLVLLQTGDDLRGQLATDGLRTGLASLTVDGSTLTGGLEFTDDCVGSAELTASIQADADRIVGSYSASDCSGQYTGTFELLRRTGQRSPPSVVITAPQAGSTFVEGDTIAFEGAGIDPDGGSLTLAWRSNLQGVLGTGSPLHTDKLSAGEHTISLIGINDDVQMRAASIRIKVSDYLTGPYVGEVTLSTEPDTGYAAALVLLQSGEDVSGQLRVGTEAIRTAVVSLTTDGAELTGGLEFTDDCAGSAEVTATIEDGGHRIVGSYSASDCGGQYTVTFDLAKRTGGLTPPDVSIYEPLDGWIFFQGGSIQFRGSGHDADGGSVALRWRSNLDGELGRGSPIYRDDLSVGDHTIELAGIDEEVQLGTDSKSIKVITAVEWPPSPSLGFAWSSAETPDADDLDLTTTFTIEMWIRPLDMLSQFLLSKWETNRTASYQFYFSEGRLRLSTREAWDRPETLASAISPLLRDVWQHVAVVFDNGEVRLYIHGLLDSVHQGMQVPQVADRKVLLGRSGSPSPNYYHGWIDEVRIWNIARTAEEIATNMTQSLTGTEPGLVAYWRLDEAEGDIAFDATGNGHDLQLGENVGPDRYDPTWSLPGTF